MLHSAITSSPDQRFVVHVLHGGDVDPDDRAKLCQMVTSLGSSLRFVEIEAAMTEALPEGYFPRTVWYRIFLPDLLPDTDKVVYLDSDVVVVDDLAPLWDVDLDGFLLGAVTNPLYSFMPPYPRTLGIERDVEYFNSGVLVMNLALMRTERTVAHLRDYASAHPGNAYPDQDALNVVCGSSRYALHARWNVQSTFFELSPSEIPLPEREVREAVENPAVLHFIGPFKPWQYLCRHPHQETYLRHAKATPWGEPRLVGRTPRTVVLRRLPLVWIDRWLRAEHALARWVASARGRLAPARRVR